MRNMLYKFKPYEKSIIQRGHLNLGGENPDGERIDVTSLYFERNGKPWIGVMGEFHFSRYDRRFWHEELCKMKAGGITIVSTYLFWIYHEEEEGKFDFTGDRDIRSFIEECKNLGLDVFIRIGPWAHGECRNGGFPDWILSYKVRTNDPDYLEKVYIWYKEIYDQVKGLFYKDGGNIIGVQLENELVNGAEHIAKLKEIALEIGIDAPIFTVTGWNSANGAKIPVDEVVPVFGGYAEAPWEAHTNPLPPSPHYFFNRMRNDSAIGVDLMEVSDDSEWRLPYERYPFATCELGGGIQITHHRRPIISGMDIYSISLVKLGSGNNLIGYYMYHGGTNKIGKYSTLNESKASGYPNDYPILSYDFQAPLSEYGEVREQYRLLNMLHLFVQDFGDILAPMEAVDAETMVHRDDVTSLRYGMRTDGIGGFVFINHYQRLSKLKDVHDVVIDTGIVTFPSIDICGDISFFMPFNMNLEGNVLEYATVQPLCREGDTYFFVAMEGITPTYKFKGMDAFDVAAGMDSVESIGNIKVVTLTLDEAKYLRRFSGGLYIGVGEDLYENDGRIDSVSGNGFLCRHWNGKTFDKLNISRKRSNPGLIVRGLPYAPFESKYVEAMRSDKFRNILWSKISVTSDKGFVSFDYGGDAAQIYADGELVADSYYYGREWRVPARMLFGKECYIAVSEMLNDFYREF